MKRPKERTTHLWNRQLGEGPNLVPVVCFPACDWPGSKPVPRELPLYYTLSECRDCIRAFSDEERYEVAEREYLTPNFQPWLDYCESIPPDPRPITSIEVPTSIGIPPNISTEVTEVPKGTDKSVVDNSPVTPPSTPVAAPIPSTQPPNPQPIGTSTWTSIAIGSPSPGEPSVPTDPQRSPGVITDNARATATFSTGGNIIQTSLSTATHTPDSNLLGGGASNSPETVVTNSPGITASDTHSTPTWISSGDSFTSLTGSPTSTSSQSAIPSSLDTPTLTGIIAGSVIAALFLLDGIIYLIRPQRRRNETPVSSDTWPGGKAQLHGKSLTPQQAPQELLDTWLRELAAETSSGGSPRGLSYAEMGELRALCELRDVRELCELREMRELREMAASTGVAELEKTYDLPRYELDGTSEKLRKERRSI